MTHTNQHNNGGFTLLEVIISMSIFLMIMLTIGMGTMSILKTWDRVQIHSKNLRKLQLIDRVVSPSFKNAIPLNWHDNDGGIASTFLGEESIVSFAYLHRINRTSEGGIRFLKLYLINGKFIAAYSNTPMLNMSGDNQNLKKEVLSENVRSISFNYAYLDKGEITWTNIWEEQGYRIPKAIQLTVEWENGESETWLRRTAGNGFKEELSIRN
jgi:prepilin-type N-terminal cleavage/methylation domain-containing protein